MSQITSRFHTCRRMTTGGGRAKAGRVANDCESPGTLRFAPATLTQIDRACLHRRAENRSLFTCVQMLENAEIDPLRPILTHVGPKVPEPAAFRISFWNQPIGIGRQPFRRSSGLMGRSLQSSYDNPRMCSLRFRAEGGGNGRAEGGGRRGEGTEGRRVREGLFTWAGQISGNPIQVGSRQRDLAAHHEGTGREQLPGLTLSMPRSGTKPVTMRERGNEAVWVLRDSGAYYQ